MLSGSRPAAPSVPHAADAVSSASIGAHGLLRRAPSCHCSPPPLLLLLLLLLLLISVGDLVAVCAAAVVRLLADVVAVFGVAAVAEWRVHFLFHPLRLTAAASGAGSHRPQWFAVDTIR